MDGLWPQLASTHPCPHCRLASSPSSAPVSTRGFNRKPSVCNAYMHWILSSPPNIHDARTYEYCIEYCIFSPCSTRFSPACRHVHLPRQGWLAYRAQYRAGPAYCSRIFIYSGLRSYPCLAGWLAGWKRQSKEQQLGG